jgi:nitroreductase
MNLIEQLNRRYAVKAMNGTKVSEEKINHILEAARLAPSASGIQPVEVFVVTNQEIKNKIREASFNQPQVSDCSHLLVFTAWDTYTEERLNDTFNVMKESYGRDMPQDYKQSLIQKYISAPAEWQAADAAKQAFLAFGVAVAAAALEATDTCPMTGFVNAQVDEILHLKEKGLKSVAFLAVGNRDSEKDWNEKLPKARRTPEKFITEIK